MSIRLDLRLLCAALLAIIVGMLFKWQPWQEQTSKKTLTVTGVAIIEEAPDQYVFTPNFTAEATSSAEAVSKASAKGNEVIAALKQMGIADDQLTTRVDSGNYSIVDKQSYPVPPQSRGDQFTALYYITAKVKDKALAQKITDYLTTTGALGGITPQAEFSPETRASLDAKVRQKAIQNARSKAETEAQELGIKLGKVVSVSEEPTSGGIKPYEGRAIATDNGASSPPVLSGTEQISLSLSVTYAIR